MNRCHRCDRVECKVEETREAYNRAHHANALLSIWPRFEGDICRSYPVPEEAPYAAAIEDCRLWAADAVSNLRKELDAATTLLAEVYSYVRFSLPVHLPRGGHEHRKKLQKAIKVLLEG